MSTSGNRIILAISPSPNRVKVEVSAYYRDYIAMGINAGLRHLGERHIRVRHVRSGDPRKIAFEIERRP